MRRALGGFCVALTAVVLVFMVAVPAGSAYPMRQARYRRLENKAPTPPQQVTATFAGGAASQPAKITCVLKINNPHFSTHAPDRINVVATWKCRATGHKSYPVAALSMTFKLFEAPFDSQLSRSSFSNKDKAYLNGHTSTECNLGDYYGTAKGTVTYPSGYTPHTATRSVTSNTESFDCVG